MYADISVCDFTDFGFASTNENWTRIHFPLQGLQQSNKGVVVDMTTSEPSLAVKIAEEGAKRNIGCIDAPVSGGDVGAREAR